MSKKSPRYDQNTRLVERCYLTATAARPAPAAPFFLPPLTSVEFSLSSPWYIALPDLLSVRYRVSLGHFSKIQLAYFDDRCSIPESSLEQDIGIGKQPLFERDDDKLTAFEPVLE
jgi:hypothetical protein